jgi:hypothetical protein
VRWPPRPGQAAVHSDAVPDPDAKAPAEDAAQAATLTVEPCVCAEHEADQERHGAEEHGSGVLGPPVVAAGEKAQQLKHLRRVVDGSVPDRSAPGSAEHGIVRAADKGKDLEPHLGRHRRELGVGVLPSPPS